MSTQNPMPPVQYITEENGRKVGVILAWEDYARLRKETRSDPDLLDDLTFAEVEALAHSKLAPERQDRLDELLERLEQDLLASSEREELDKLLAQVDQLNILKARALLTLQQRSQKSTLTSLKKRFSHHKGHEGHKE